MRHAIYFNYIYGTNTLQRGHDTLTGSINISEALKIQTETNLEYLLRNIVNIVAILLIYCKLIYFQQ